MDNQSKRVTKVRSALGVWTSTKKVCEAYIFLLIIPKFPPLAEISIAFPH